MSSAQGTRATRSQEAVLQRCYDANPEACTRAVALLLQSPVDKKKAAGVTSTSGDEVLVVEGKVLP